MFTALQSLDSQRTTLGVVVAYGDDVARGGVEHLCIRGVGGFDILRESGGSDGILFTGGYQLQSRVFGNLIIERKDMTMSEADKSNFQWCCIHGSKGYYTMALRFNANYESVLVGRSNFDS